MTLTNLQPKQKPTQPLEQDKTQIKKVSLSPSNCRFCKFYRFERGEGGGFCGKLGVSVCGHWRSCRLGLTPFATSWEKANEEIFR
jgi:hypothetical protein